MTAAIAEAGEKLDSAPGRPLVRLKPGGHRRLVNGHPWVFSNEIEMGDEAKRLAPGDLAILTSAEGERLGVFTFNPHPLISARLLTRDPDARIDAPFIAARLGRARDLRDRIYGEPFYRLIHAEADGLPGVIIDRFGSAFSLQTNTAGAERLLPLIREALDLLFGPGLLGACGQGRQSGQPRSYGPLVLAAEICQRGVLHRSHPARCRLQALAAARRRAHEHDPLIPRAALNQPRRLEAEDGRVHRLPRDLRDAGKLRGGQLGPGPEQAQDPVVLRGQPEVLQFAVQQRPEALVREPEQVAQIRVRLGERPR